MGSIVRLLPWPGPDGKPCYLQTDDQGGFLSRLADEMEAVQLTTGGELLGHARSVLDGREASPVELRFLVARLSEALTDALRVARSRGDRIPVPGDDDTGDACLAPSPEASG